MALLPPRNVRLAPPTMPDAGGSVTFVFEAQTTGAPTRLQATYSVPAPQPYVFENATDPGEPRVIVGDPQDVTGDPDDYPQLLRLRKSPPGGPLRKNVRVNADVVELDANDRPVPPTFKLTGRITIVP